MASVLLLKGLGGCSQGFFVYWEESRKESQRNLANPNVLNRKELFIMMYPFMTLDDKTEVVHSEVYDSDGTETVKVYFEKPVYGGFHSAECYLPSYEWRNIDGFSPEEIEIFQEYLQSVAHIVIRLAREGGFDNAANF